MKRYTLAELKALTTLETGQWSDLKIETETTRIWLSRNTIKDGEPYDNKVYVETYENGRWEITDTYQAFSEGI